MINGLINGLIFSELKICDFNGLFSFNRIGDNRNGGHRNLNCGLLDCVRMISVC